MRISVKENGKGFLIPIPNCIIFSSLSIRILKAHSPSGTGKVFDGLKPKHMRQIRKTVRRMRKIHKGWSLVDVRDSDGSSVIIKL